MKANIRHCFFSFIAGANKHYVFTALFLVLSILSAAQLTPAIKWQQSLGGDSPDQAKDIKETSDFGYIVAGLTTSTNGNVTGNHGYSDCWIVKLNEFGVLQWQKCLGGSDNEGASSIEETFDGGFIVAGATSSYDGDVSGNHGGPTGEDCWIVKLDENGNIQWQKCLGGTGADYASSVKQTDDGGYIVAGTSNSNDGDVSGHHGTSTYNDYWIVKLSSLGAIEWQHSLGGSDQENASSVRQTFDGGYIVAGSSRSTDGDATANHGDLDYWIVKLDKDGLIEWQKSLGGGKIDNANSIEQVPDLSGYVIAGNTTSTDGQVNGVYGDQDCWIVKIDNSGDILLTTLLGGSAYDNASSIKSIHNGGDGFIIAGTSSSNDHDVSGNHGMSDYWIVELTANFDLHWQKSFGGSSGDFASCILQTLDDTYIIAGSSYSINGDVSGNHGAEDYWIVKLGAEVFPLNVYLTIANGNWSNPATWLGNVVPPPGAGVRVKHVVSVDIDVVCNELFIEPASSLSVNPGISITVTR